MTLDERLLTKGVLSRYIDQRKFTLQATQVALSMYVMVGSGHMGRGPSFDVLNVQHMNGYGPNVGVSRQPISFVKDPRV